MLAFMLTSSFCVLGSLSVPANNPAHLLPGALLPAHSPLAISLPPLSKPWIPSQQPSPQTPQRLFSNKTLKPASWCVSCLKIHLLPKILQHQGVTVAIYLHLNDREPNFNCRVNKKNQAVAYLRFYINLVKLNAWIEFHKKIHFSMSIRTWRSPQQWSTVFVGARFMIGWLKKKKFLPCLSSMLSYFEMYFSERIATGHCKAACTCECGTSASILNRFLMCDACLNPH